MNLVAAGVAEIVLHVANDRVLPISKIDATVGAHLDVSRPKIWIAGRDNGLQFNSRWKRLGVWRKRVVHNSLKSNDVAHEQVALHVGRKMRT